MAHLRDESIISSSEFEDFIGKLSITKTETGPDLATAFLKEKLTTVQEDGNKTILESWLGFLHLIKTQEKHFVLLRQSKDTFAIKWNEEDLDIVKQFVCEKASFFYVVWKAQKEKENIALGKKAG